MNLFNFFRKVVLEPNTKGSVAFRVAEHDAKVAEAKGAIIALKAAEKSHHADLKELENAAADVRMGRDVVQLRIDNLQKGLGF